jgi:hypothetical protein
VNAFSPQKENPKTLGKPENLEKHMISMRPRLFEKNACFSAEKLRAHLGSMPGWFPEKPCRRRPAYYRHAGQRETEVFDDVEYQTSFAVSDELPVPAALPGNIIRPKREVFCYAQANTLYKRKADKVRPVNSTDSDGSVPIGDPNWESVCFEKYHRRFLAKDEPSEFDDLLNPRIATIARGARLTPEREEKLLIGNGLLPREKLLLRELLFKREGVLAWSWEHMGRIREEVAPPQRIKTVKHESWQHPGFKIPRALYPIVIEMLQDRLRKGVLEFCDGPYRNPWFLVKKKLGKYRLINAAMMINKVTKRDANMPPDIDEFAEDFSGMAMASLVDLYSGYDQIALHPEDRDLTAIQTPLGLLRQTTILQGAANSVPQFQRVISLILYRVFGIIARPFLDDIAVKGPRTRYDDEFARPGIRRYVLEHLQNLDKTLYLLELAGAVISAEKSQFAMGGVEIVGWVCDFNGRHPEESKVAKLVEWPVPKDKDELRSFVGLAVYFRILVEFFQIIMEPLYFVLRKDSKFEWGEPQQIAFDRVKEKLSTFPAVLPIDYTFLPLSIIVVVDGSKGGWGGVLVQERNGVRKPARYESGVWTKSQQTYDSGKLECRAVLMAFKKFRHWLYGVHFTLETDCNTLVAQLNRPASDLPGALVTRWMAWIHLFDFDVKHIPGPKNGAADGLSRRPATQRELHEQSQEMDVDDFVDAEITYLQASCFPARAVLSAEEAAALQPLHDGYSAESQDIARYLISLRRPPEMPMHQFNDFKKKCMKYVVQDQHLFYRDKGKTGLLRRVLDDHEERQRVLSGVHTELSHKGKEATYDLLKRRYYWLGMYEAVVRFVRTCADCQARDPVRVHEPAVTPDVLRLFDKWFVDVTHMPQEDDFKCVVQAREAVSGWIEGRYFKRATSDNIRSFIKEDIICRHGYPREIVLDSGPENRSETNHFIKRHGIKRVVISAYHPESNGPVERAMRTLKDALSKMTGGYPREQNGRPKNGWRQHFHAALMADRTTVNASTGISPFYFLYGVDAVLPIELEVPTWSTLPWHTVKDRSDLIAMRARQIERRDKDVEEAVLRMKRLKENNASYFDDTHVLRHEPLAKNDIVLLHDTIKSSDMTSVQKLRYRWQGPYRIREVKSNGSYVLEELDGTALHQLGDRAVVNGDRLKRFHFNGSVPADNLLPRRPPAGRPPGSSQRGRPRGRADSLLRRRSPAGQPRGSPQRGRRRGRPPGRSQRGRRRDQ